jgi:hypothetical protein
MVAICGYIGTLHFIGTSLVALLLRKNIQYKNDVLLTFGGPDAWDSDIACSRVLIHGI